MRDDHGHFGRYKQALYYARLHIEHLESLEQCVEPSANQFTRQQLQCFFDSTVIQLVRSLCSLACVALPVERTSSLLASPRIIEKTLQEAADELPTASLKTLRLALVAPLSGSSGDDEPLSQLLIVFSALWVGESPAVTPVDPNLIQSSSRQLGSAECRSWHRQLQQLGDDIVNLQTES